MVLNCHVCLAWPCVASYGLFVAFYGHQHVRPCVASLWPLYGIFRPYTVFYGRISSFIAVIDPKSFGLVSFFFTRILSLRPYLIFEFEFVREKLVR